MTNAVRTVKLITRAYFLGCLAMSASHAVEAAHMAGLTGYEAYAVPVLVDGVAALGMTLRSETFSTRTQRDGLRVQAAMTAVSMIINVYAATSWGGVVLGMALPGLYMAAEWLSGRVESATTEQAARAAQRRSEAARRAAATRRAQKEAGVTKISTKRRSS